MRLAPLAALIIFIVAGCSSSRSGNPPPASQSRPPARTNPTALTVTPAAGTVTGKVAHVNPSARFVVLSFPLGSLPALDKRLGVYRDGMKVGELKVTGPARDQNTVADITRGDAQVGDEVKE